jgi:hypothetical protein
MSSNPERHVGFLTGEKFHTFDNDSNGHIIGRKNPHINNEERRMGMTTIQAKQFQEDKKRLQHEQRRNQQYPPQPAQLPVQPPKLQYQPQYLLQPVQQRVQPVQLPAQPPKSHAQPTYTTTCTKTCTST